MTFDPKDARALVEHFKNDQPVTQDMQSTMMAEEMQLAADALTAALDENERLREALRPFAEYMQTDEGRLDRDNHGNDLPDNDGVGWVYLTHGDFRAARTALERKEGA